MSQRRKEIKKEKELVTVRGGETEAEAEAKAEAKEKVDEED